jgi:hypothetical protein
MKILVLDHGGLYPQIASSLWHEAGDVIWYWTAWEQTNPHYKDYSIGLGFGNLTKVMEWQYYVDDADAIVFLDCLGGGDCWLLRRLFPDKPIFGAGRGTLLEQDRVKFKQWIDRFKLPHNPYRIITGTEKLVDYLKTNEDKFVKINVFRGDMESFFAKDYASVECKLDEQIIPALGPHKNDHKFVVEDAIDADIELGLDGFFNGLDIIQPYFLGYELDKALTIQFITPNMPDFFVETMAPFTELMRKLDYRGAFSIEEKIKSQQKHYALDFCARLANPLSAGYPLFIKNFRELILKIASREPVEVVCDYKYLGAYPLITQSAQDSNVEVRIDEGHKEAIRYQMVTSREGRNYAVKGWSIAAIIVAAGNSIDEVFENIRKELPHVHADGLDTSGIIGEEKMREQIKKGENIGIKFA